jgi:hypothetical protein
MRIIFLTFFLLFASESFSQNDTLILFYDVDKSILLSPHQKSIDEFLLKHKNSDIKRIYVNGFTDTTASKDYNIQLSSRRSGNVKSYLSTKSLTKEILTESFFGESKSKFPKDMQKDRRVEIILICNQTAITNSITTIKDFYKISALKPQEFCIRNDKDTTILCKKGTIVYIKANSFSMNDKLLKTDQCITFQIKEAFLNSEMILENLSTVADGRILETQGMIYTNALLGNDSLELVRDIIIIKPTDKIVENVKVFDGERDPHSDIMNWTLNNNSVLQNFSLSNVLDCPPVSKPNPCGVYYGVGDNKKLARIDVTAECNDWLLPKRGLGGPCQTYSFFGRIGRIPKGIKGTFNKQQKEENKQVRKCIRDARKYKRLMRKIRRSNGSFKDKQILRLVRFRIQNLKSKGKLTKEEEEALEILEKIEESDRALQDTKITIENKYKCEQLDSLFRTYGVTNSKELIKALNKPLMDKLNVKTMEELMEAIPKVNLQNLELAYQNKKISYEDYKFYIFNSSKLGWKNLDVFANLSNDKLTTIKIKLKPAKFLDCKLIYPERKFVLPAGVQADYFYFENIPKEEKAWLVSLKYENGIPFLGIKLIDVNQEWYEVEFISYSLEQLKEKLKILDFNE